MKNIAKILAAFAWSMTLLAAPAFAAVEDDVAKLQHEWERIKYQTPQAEQEKGYEQLVKEADKAVAQNPNRAETLIWHGIIDASYAGAKGGLGALSLAKSAKSAFEHALEIDPNALSGSAYTSLGSLYYQVPGWPIGFGDDKKALTFLKKGLAANPDGIDPNYFYGDFLFRAGDLDNAERVLRKALQAAPRTGRKISDEGRRNEINQLLDKIAAKRK
ncbi:tetratricopeptide repeat protein [Herminiimonas aquatilis]|uniref:Tetratricopeptide repeat protein n=1 Tax=Herminiimonas aquatilis TaxID=345342 RepID=A0ABW2J2K7_9BURK